MDDIILSLSLPPETNSFIAGEAVSGILTVDVKTKTTCEQLRISCELQLTKSRRVNTLKSHRITLFSGEWDVGTYHYPFTLNTSIEDFNYKGENISLEWVVSTKAELPWLKSVEDNSVIALLPSREASIKRGFITAPLTHRTTEPKHSFEILTATIVGLLILIHYGLDDPFKFWLLVPTLPIALALNISNIKSFLTQYLFRSTTVETTKNQYRLGEMAELNFHHKIHRRFALQEVRLYLLVEERTRSSTEAKKYKESFDIVEPIHSQSKYCDELDPHEMTDAFNPNVNFELPKHLPSSFRYMSHAITWSLCADIHHRHLPKYTIKREIIVTS